MSDQSGFPPSASGSKDINAELREQMRKAAEKQMADNGVLTPTAAGNGQPTHPAPTAQPARSAQVTRSVQSDPQGTQSMPHRSRTHVPPVGTGSPGTTSQTPVDGRSLPSSSAGPISGIHESNIHGDGASDHPGACGIKQANTPPDDFADSDAPSRQYEGSDAEQPSGSGQPGSDDVAAGEGIERLRDDNRQLRADSDAVTSQPGRLRFLLETQMIAAKTLTETLGFATWQVVALEEELDKSKYQRKLLEGVADDVDFFSGMADIILKKPKTVINTADMAKQMGEPTPEDDEVAKQRNQLYHRSRKLVWAMEGMGRYLSEDIRRSHASLEVLLSEYRVHVEGSDDAESDNEHLTTTSIHEVAAPVEGGGKDADDEPDNERLVKTGRPGVDPSVGEKMEGLDIASEAEAMGMNDGVVL